MSPVQFMRELVVLPIRFYQRFLSPLKPPVCRFRPTCSEYGLIAVRKHGIFKGALLLSWRILRCQPFGTPGFDPVPEASAWPIPVAKRRFDEWPFDEDAEPPADP
ncbi:MAG: membrane protein insertion efficiency factor YidD [Planctomycetota bacterium]